MRLTKDIKAQTLSAALVCSGVPELEAAIRKRYAAWIEAVRVRVITPEVEQVQEKIKELKAGLPQGLFDSNLRTDSDMFVNVAGAIISTTDPPAPTQEPNVESVLKR